MAELIWEYRQVGEIDQIWLGVSEVWYAWHGDNLYMITLSGVQDIGYDVTYHSPCGHNVYLGWGPCIEYARGLAEIFVDYTASRQMIRDDLDGVQIPRNVATTDAAIEEVRLVRERE